MDYTPLVKDVEPQFINPKAKYEAETFALGNVSTQ
jgi:hypothetical protein